MKKLISELVTQVNHTNLFVDNLLNSVNNLLNSSDNLLNSVDNLLNSAHDFSRGKARNIDLKPFQRFLIKTVNLSY